MRQLSKMTEISRTMYLSATNNQLTLHQAIEILKDEANIRKVRDTLAYFSKIPLDRIDELKTFLTERLSAGVPGAKHDAVRRKVQLWMNDDALSVSKQSAIQIAFALNLKLDEADLMLKRLCGEGFHWRDPEELVYGYALIRGMSYADAFNLYESIKDKIVPDPSKKSEIFIYTRQVNNRVLRITSDEELIDFLCKSKNSLGQLHNTAYSLFKEYMDLLSKPVIEYDKVFRPDDDEKKKYAEKVMIDIKKNASRDIMDTYLYRKFIPVAQRKSKNNPEPEKVVFSALQRNVRLNWPDEVTLSKMLHRETDVTRKVLILLFLATDGGDTKYADRSDFERSPEEIFISTYGRLNLMLNQCGFAELDPRVQFDWMVLYCICVDDVIFIDGKIQRFLAEIFPSNGAVPDLMDSE